MAWLKALSISLCIALCSTSAFAEEKLDRTRAILERNEVTQTTSDFDPEAALPYTRALQGLAFCIAILLVGAHLVKRFKKPSQQAHSPFLIEGRINVTPKTTITLLSIEGKRVLVASGGDSVSLMPLENSTDEMALLREVQVCERPLQ